ncbi:MAG: ruvC [Parcubacteria group bacterium]|nr:ruvC [Parcubacteria group bacterium]
MSRILGIDPGFDRLGLAVLEGDPSRPTHIWSECVRPAAGTAEERLSAVTDAVTDAIRAYAPDAVALETLYFSTNKKTALAVAEARGAVLSAIGAEGLPVLEFSPGTVKLAVTGYGNADKKAIALMVPKLLTLPPKKRLDDEFDAIAIAIAGLSTRR